MKHSRGNLLLVGVLVNLLMITACSPAAATTAPTFDANPVRTEAAATVLAQVTRDLALTPSITPLPSATETQQPSSTPEQTVSPSPAAEGTQAETADKAQWVSQSVADGTIFGPGQAFTMTWRLKNTGTSTWTTGYLLRFYSGDAFGAPKEVFLDRDVPPGDEVEINLQMKAPAKPGVYRSDWVMSNTDRANFKEPVFLKIVVAVTATPNPSATPTP